MRSHIDRLSTVPFERFTLPWSLRVDMVYELICSAMEREAQREKILDLLPALLMGRCVPFPGSSHESLEERMREQAQLFFDRRDLFIHRIPLAGEAGE